MKSKSILPAALAGMLMMSAACSGNIDESAELVLAADKTSIVADGTDAVTFTVTLGGEDVTSSATVNCISPSMAVVENASFTTTQAGTYSFEAEYDGNRSSVRIVTATEAPAVPSRFVREICVMEFTGQWCAQCPGGYQYLYYVVSTKYPDNAHIIALHNNTGGKDEMALAIEPEIFKNYSLTGYPSAVIDMRDPSPLTSDTGGILTKSLKSSETDYPAHCGVAVSTEGTETVNVKVRIASEKSSDYSLAIWVVENGIKATQNVGGTYKDDYTHGHVARRLVSANWKGDSIGGIPAGEEAEKTYTIAIDPEWNLDNTSVYALAIDAQGYVNNMAVCPILNGNTGYRYIAE